MEEKNTIVESVQSFIKTCPHMKQYKKLFPMVSVDKLKSDPDTYMILPTPAEPWVMKYVDGTGKKQFLFSLCSKEFYSTDDRVNLKNHEFYEQFSEWLEECTEKGNLPVLKKGQECYKIEALTTGYIFDEQETKAQYQIQCKLEYYQN